MVAALGGLGGSLAELAELQGVVAETHGADGITAAIRATGNWKLSPLFLRLSVAIGGYVWLLGVGGFAERICEKVGGR